MIRGRVRENYFLNVDAERLAAGYRPDARASLTLRRAGDAPDESTTSEQPILFGAVTTGEDWRFGICKRQEKEIIEDLKLYRVTEELTELMNILVGIIKG